MNIVSTSSAPTAAPVFASRNRSRFRARFALVGLSACGLAALAWTAFVQPLPRLVYNPSDSVAIGWYRVEPFNLRADLLPRPLSAGSIILTRLPPDAAALAALRGYLSAHIPLLKRVGAIAPQHVCIVDSYVHIDSVPVAAVLSRVQCKRRFYVSDAALRAVFKRADSLLQTLPACGHRCVCWRAVRPCGSAATPPLPRAKATGKGGRQD